ncbi:MAG: hypothetical protein R2718_04275 [Solirubrobacterales bacterium]
MSTHALKLSTAQRAIRLSTDDFLWRPRPLPSSFRTTLDPGLEQLGRVDPLNADLVRLATLVYLVDRTDARPRTWIRDLDLAVPVSDPDRWNEFAEPLADLLGFLSGDRWILHFERLRRRPAAGEAQGVSSEQDTCLFSGGADSLAGAIVLSESEMPALVSHSDMPVVSATQNEALGRLEALRQTEADYFRVTLTRTTNQLRTGEAFGREATSRTRSFLFIALGLAVASQRSGTLNVPENGFASLNVPLSGERRGALSTRTTHPGFLEGLEALLQEAGLSLAITNPFGRCTKGELFARVKSAVGRGPASDILSASYSCAKPDARWFGLPPSTQCGLCFGCLVRRAAFIAASVEDQTDYAEQMLSGRRRTDYLSDARLSVYRAVQYAVQRGITEADILTLSLPESFAIDDATDLAKRGLAELAAVHVP